MKTLTRFTLMIVILSGLFSLTYASELTPAQINFVIDNSDTHVFMPEYPVKSVIVSITQASDNSTGEERAEYNEQGLLSKYSGRFSYSPGSPEYMSIRVEVTQPELNQWRSEQKISGVPPYHRTVKIIDGKVIIEEAENGQPASFLEEKSWVKDDTGQILTLGSGTDMADETYELSFRFNPQGQLASSSFENIVYGEYGYVSQIQNRFGYSDEHRLTSFNQSSVFYLASETPLPEETVIKYTAYDEYGNWTQKVEHTDGESMTYQRKIEYW